MSEKNVINLQAARPSIRRSRSMQEKVDRAMRWQMDHVINDICLSHGLEADYARKVERELKRYLVLRSILQDRDHGVSTPVDELWHKFLTYTRDYADFCWSIGGGFIHHDPTPSVAVNTVSLHMRYGQTLHDYKEIFGEEAPNEIWPIIPYPAVGAHCG